MTPDPRLTREIEESILTTVEDVLETPARILTPLRIKLTEDDEGMIITVLKFEARIDA